ncbi:MAG: nuclear transport factor 2 family protein [Pyrinomonadaceae bacterium]
MTSQIRTQAAPALSRDAQAVTKLVHDWVEAGGKRDTAALDLLLAEGFIISTPFGIVTKSRYLEGITSGEIVLDSVSLDDTTLREYGDEAVVSGIVTVKGQHNGHDISGQYRYRYAAGHVKWSEHWQAINCEAHRIR